MTPACPGSSLSNVVTNSAVGSLSPLYSSFTSAFLPFLSMHRTQYPRMFVLLSYYAHTLSAVKGVFRCRCEHGLPDNYFGRDETLSDEKLLPFVKCGGYVYIAIPAWFGIATTAFLPSCFSHGHRSSLTICTMYRIDGYGFKMPRRKKC